ncbi:MAG: BrnT family toxin [Desulfobulbus sp.]|nr:BrnT family toxin [Desulfobulbus sp.]
MKFEWHAQKSEDCFQDRGFDFTYAARAFLDPNRTVRKDGRYNYEETRYILMGKIDFRLFCIVYTMRNDVIRIISARKANAREAKLYEKNLNDR